MSPSEFLFLIEETYEFRTKSLMHDQVDLSVLKHPAKFASDWHGTFGEKEISVVNIVTIGPKKTDPLCGYFIVIIVEDISDII